MGLTAFTIGRRRPTTDDASPEGAVAQLRSTQFGTALIWALVVGLVLYVAWRLISVALIRGNDGKKWLERVGYLFSAGFYAVLAFTAVTAVMKPKDTKDKNTVERLSAWMLGHPVGRWALLVAGIVVIGVGIFFIVDKGLKKSFLKELDLSNAPEAERKAMPPRPARWAGSAAARQPPRSASSSPSRRGATAPTMPVASTTRSVNWRRHEVGSIAVLVTGLALVVYGVFSALIVRHLDLDKVS